jgi:hypothetical protein
MVGLLPGHAGVIVHEPHPCDSKPASVGATDTVCGLAPPPLVMVALAFRVKSLTRRHVHAAPPVECHVPGAT